MKYLKYFENSAAIGGGVEVDLPNVSYLEDSNVLFGHGNEGTATIKINSSTGTIYRDYASEYLTFEALEAGAFTLTIGSAITTTLLSSVSYSLDNGDTWTTTNNVDSQTVTITTPSVEKGQKVLWKGNGTAMSIATNSTAAANRAPSSSIFSSSGEFDVYGNIMSLLCGDNFVGQTSFANGSSSNFALLFYCYNMANVAKIRSAKNCILPVTVLTSNCYTRMFQASPTLINTPALSATTMANYCYAAMFNGCTKLTASPELPAAILVDYCYYYMFSGCGSLTTAPALSATTLATYCYYGMFYGCTSLTTAPALPVTTLADSCYSAMFEGCTSLTTAPELPATTLANSCYFWMFRDCTNLTAAPQLPATILTDWCYREMFMNCSNLIAAPELPATTLAERCYQHMFYGCTSLTTAPALPATTLAGNCYAGMFRDCTSLNEITCYATDISAANSTENWVSGVASTGTFKKNASMSSWTTGVNGIPSGWTIVDA